MATVEQLRLYRKRWYEKNREKVAASQKRYRETHRAAINARARERERILRDACFTLLGSICAVCGFSDKRALQFDHLANDGSNHRRQRGISGALRDILKGEGKGYQVLCANCNWIRHLEREA